MFVVVLILLFGPLYSNSALEPVHIIAYEDEPVILPSRRNSSWNLDRIQWSILSNITFIATLRRGELSTDLFWRYLGRLTLNTTTGDLHVNNVTKNDSTLYSVLLMAGSAQENHKVELEVRDQLPTPHLKHTVRPIHEGHCKVILRCRTQRGGLAISWNSTLGPLQSQHQNSSVLQEELKQHSTANFTCIITDNIRHKSSTTQVSCQSQDRHRYICACLLTFWAGLLYGGYRRR